MRCAVVTGLQTCGLPISGATIPEVTIPKGSSVTLKAASTGAVSYQWFREGEVIDGALEAEYSAGEAGVYTVLARNVGGCTSDMSEGVQVIVDERQLLADLEVLKSSESRNVVVSEKIGRAHV